MTQFSIQQDISKEKLQKVFDGLDVHPLTLQLLYKRGIKNKKDAGKFLNPSYEDNIGDPFLIHGMKKSIERIVGAIKKGEKIAVYSDYDCDGIPGGVLLRTVFSDIGYPIEMYIPHRHNEGYGVHNHAIDSLKQKGVMLIITVDSGITNLEEVAYGKSIGVDFIITDHHLPIHKELKNGNKKQIVPDAVAVINSKQDICTYHDDMLCGCAVAWKLSCALLTQLRKEKKSANKKFQKVLDKVVSLGKGYEKWLLDLVGISTISDMVPLVKENRTLAYYGLKVLKQTKRHGLNHIFHAQGITKEYLNEDDISFTIAPRINAASRMGDPIQAHIMLYEKDAHKAQQYVEELEALNTERKLGVKDITENISFDHEVYKNDVIVVGDISWGPGILGLIAQKIIDETGKPTFVWGQGDDKNVVKGSCRSKGDVHVVELMSFAQNLFPNVITHSGGHEQAGGFECDLDNVSKLSDVLNETIKHIEKKDLGKEDLIVHAQLSMQDVNIVTHNAVQALAPFGVGNEKPLFAFTKVAPTSVRWFGKKGEHLEIFYEKIKAIMFFAPKELGDRAKKEHTLLAHLEKSHWRGKGELRLRIREVI